jgi:hypothetical protein
MSLTNDIKVIPDVCRTYTNLFNTLGETPSNNVQNLHRFGFAAMKHICFIVNQIDLTHNESKPTNPNRLPTNTYIVSF